MSSSAVNSRVLPLVWQLLLVSLAFVPAGWAAVANCTPSWEWVRSARSGPCGTPSLVDLTNLSSSPACVRVLKPFV